MGTGKKWLLKSGLGIFLTLVLVLGPMGMMAHAVPVCPDPMEAKQADGSPITIFHRGDEFFSWVEDENGYVIAFDEDSASWYYAFVNGDEEIVPGPEIVGTARTFVAAMEGLSGPWPRMKRSDLAPLFAKVDYSAVDIPVPGGGGDASPDYEEGGVVPYEHNAGERTPLLLLLIEYNDSLFQAAAAAPYAADTNTFWSQRFFDASSHGTVNNYYKEVSGALDLQFVKPTYTAAVTEGVAITTGLPTGITSVRIKDGVALVHLDRNHPNVTSTGGQTATDVRFAFTGVRDYLDLSGCVRNGTSILSDQFIVYAILAGYENSYNGSSIPSTGKRVPGHASYSTATNAAGKQRKIVLTSVTTTPALSSYAVQGELGNWGATSVAPISLGVSVHELGHILGAPDLYSYTSNLPAPNEGIGYYSVMASGSWGIDQLPGTLDSKSGASPVHFEAYTRSMLGFSTPLTKTSTDYWKGNIRSFNDASSYNALKITNTTASADQYFLVENRQLTGYDRGLSRISTGLAGGILIWHVDNRPFDTYTTYGGARANDNNGHRAVALEKFSSSNTINVFYGAGSVFDATSTPANSNFHSGPHPNWNAPGGAGAYYHFDCCPQTVPTGIEIKVNGANSTAIEVEAGLPETYGISLDITGSHDFGSAAYGYVPVTPLTVTVENTGNQPTGALSVTLTGTNGTSFAITDNNAASGIATPGGTATFKVGPNSGLAAGTTYEATVNVTGSNGISATFTLSFTVTKAAPTVTWPSGLEATYGDTLSDISLLSFDNSGGTPGVFTWTTPANPVGSVGTRAHNMTFTPTDSASYTTVNQNVNVEVKAGAITSAAVTVTAPVVAVAPSSVASGTGNFAVGAVTWTPAGSPFKGGTQYTAQVTLTANTNYAFASSLTSATINGANATVSGNTGNAVTLSYQFPATAAATVNGISVIGQPTKLGYSVGDALALSGLSARLSYNDGTQETVAFEDFASKAISTVPTDGAALALADDGTAVAVSCNGYTANTSALTVTKAPGAAVAAPTAASKTANNVTLNAVTAPVNGQAVEYAWNTSNTPPGTGWQSGLSFDGLAEYTQYYFFARAVENGGYAQGAASAGTAVRTADVTPPTGEIAIKTSSWTTFWNTVTFGLFFKNTVDVDIASDDGSGSGVAAVEYFLTDEDLPDTTDWTEIAWEAGASTGVPANWKGIVYARITDNAGNETVIRSDGVVVYTDSAQDTASISFAKDGTSDVTANGTLNGNTIEKIMNGAATLVNGTDYTVSGGAITFKASYLDTLAVAGYTLTVHYNPLGEAYVAGGGNEAPATTAIALTVTKAAPTVTWPSGLEATYGDTLSDISLLSFDNSGGTPGVFTWTTSANPVGSVGTRAHNMTFTPTDSASYTTVNQNVNVEVKAGAYAVSLDISNDAIATVANLGSQPTGDLTLTISGENADAFELSTDALSSIAVGGTSSFTVTPKAGLTAGTYTATVTLNGEHGIFEVFDVSFTVDPDTDTKPTIICRRHVILRYRGSRRLHATGENLYWSSSNPNLVTVDQTGKVTSVKGCWKIGTAIIRAENSAGYVEFKVKVHPTWLQWHWLVIVRLCGWLWR